MRICDICGSKKNVNLMVLPHLNQVSVIYLANEQIDVCEDCRREIAKFINKLKRGRK